VDSGAVSPIEGIGGRRAIVADGETFERIKIKQTRGPQIRFEGALLASQEWQARGRKLTIEVWETRAGALIGASYGEPTSERGGIADVRAHVVEPSDDPLAMQFEIMDFFDWDNRARSMAQRELGWKLVREVD